MLRYDIDTGQKISDTISIFFVPVKLVEFPVYSLSQKKHLAVGWGMVAIMLFVPYIALNCYHYNDIQQKISDLIAFSNLVLSHL